MDGKQIFILIVIAIGIIGTIIAEIFGYGQLLIFSIVFGVIGFIISKIFGINPARIVSDIFIIPVIAAIIYFFVLTYLSPDKMISTFSAFLLFFVKNIPSMLIGDVAGTIVAKFTGENE